MHLILNDDRTLMPTSAALDSLAVDMGPGRGCLEPFGLQSGVVQAL